MADRRPLEREENREAAATLVALAGTRLRRCIYTVLSEDNHAVNCGIRTVGDYCTVHRGMMFVEGA